MTILATSYFVLKLYSYVLFPSDTSVVSSVMATSALVGVFLLAVLPHSVLAVHHTYYVKPTNDTQCPGEPCLTLSQYIQESGKYFISNTTMLFLPGEHQLDSTFLVYSVTSFALQGDTSSLPELASKIVGVNEMGNFQFYLIQQLDIRALHFSQCGFSDTQAIVALNLGDFRLDMNILESSPSVALLLDGITNASLLNNTFVGNKAMRYGAAISVFSSTVLLKNNSFINNELNLFSEFTLIGTGAIYTRDSSLDFSATNIFSNNSANVSSGGALQARNTTITMSGNIEFVNNSAFNGGAISVYSSVLSINGNASFEGNMASTGGGAIGMYTDIYSQTPKLYLNPNALLKFWKNNATTGGAIFVQDSNPFKYCPEVTDSNCRQDDCFFQVVDQNASTGFSSKLEFINNSAVESGDAIFGGMIDHCSLIGLPASSSSEVFDMITTLEQPGTTSAISSYPLHICSCENGYPNCGSQYRAADVYAGERFAVSGLVAVGQRNGTVPANILSFFYKNSDDNVRFGDFEAVQPSRGCGDHHYSVFTLEDNVTAYWYLKNIDLYPQGPCPIFGGNALTILVQLYPCPTGFARSPTTGGCVCEERLMTYSNSCNITDQTILREGPFWVGYDNASDDLILSPHCPFDYCKSKPVHFKLTETDLQCSYNRSGLLCGSCQPGLSLVLGSNRCLPCSNIYLSLLIVFAVAGFILVLFLLACKLTVASGTINGLVFYANVVFLNKSTFFPAGARNPLTIFIAWLNLDLGIETCFYNGMDAYDKMWLQFVFPLYVFALAGLIILFSRFSRRLTRLLGSNPVAVLATLLLLSFTRLLRTITNVLALTSLEYKTHEDTVWALDGGIRYLHNKHIALFVVAVLIFLVLYLPYTLVLVLGQWLLKSNRRILSWVNKPQIRYFLDAYYAPYKENHRYWPGMLLVLRHVMLLVYDTTFFSDGSTNLLIISAATLGLELWVSIGKQVYKNKYLDILEGSFIFNLGLLAAATYHVRQTSGNQAAVVYTSVSVALATFIVIVVYHAYQQLKHSGYCMTCLKNIHTESVSILDKTESLVPVVSESSPISVSHTTVSYGNATECREPLLDSQ